MHYASLLAIIFMAGIGISCIKHFVFGKIIITIVAVVI